MRAEVVVIPQRPSAYSGAGKPSALNFVTAGHADMPHSGMRGSLVRGGFSGTCVRVVRWRCLSLSQAIGETPCGLRPQNEWSSDRDPTAFLRSAQVRHFGSPNVRSITCCEAWTLALKGPMSEAAHITSGVTPGPSAVARYLLPLPGGCPKCGKKP
jgi:hypothetical protein